jgi:hypothetical protein
VTLEYSIGDMPGPVAQVEECPAWRANDLLAAGFHFVGFMSRTSEQDRRSYTEGHPEQKTFIRHDFAYIIGRTADQPAFPVRKPRETPKP